MAELVIRKTVKVEAPLATLWKVLTDNEFIPQYMFGCYAETDWKPGSPLLWKGAADQKPDFLPGGRCAADPVIRVTF